jgi:hypothetical protein
MIGPRFLYLNYLRADSGSSGEHQLPRDYVMACRFLHCGITARTCALDQQSAA